MSSDAAGGNGAVLSARGLGKCYHVYERPADRLKQAVIGWRLDRKYYREFWALRGVDFELRRGEALGIVGRNGSGKSTLLQIIAGTLPPTTGEVEIVGRVGALLELGSGFNPQFSGRENVILQGTLLGYPPALVAEQMPEIEAFAEIGAFIDQPVKCYSSGMFVRLAFATQVAFEPEVLIVDEALAVGDAAFQIKCMSRMRRMLDHGVTILLATHDVGTVRSFCSSAMWIHEGEVRARGDTQATTSAYVQFLFGRDEPVSPPPMPAATAKTEAGPRTDALAPAAARRELRTFGGRSDLVRWGNGNAQFVGFRLSSASDGEVSAALFKHGEPFRLEVEIRAETDLPTPNLGVGFSIRNTKGLDLITFTTFEHRRRLAPMRRGDRLRMVFDFPNILIAGDYALVLNFEEVAGTERIYLDFIENALMFRVACDTPSFSVVAPPVTAAVVEPGPDVSAAGAR